MNGFADRGLDEGNFDGSEAFSALRSFDAFPKTKQSYVTRTRNGTFWTVLLAVGGFYLVLTEIGRWFEGQTVHMYGVEKGVSHDLQINLDIVVAMRCQDLHVNIQDAAGDRVLASEKLHLEPTKWRQWRDSRTPLTKEEQAAREIPDWMREQVAQYRDDEDVHDYLKQIIGRRRFPNTPKLKGEPDSCRIYGNVESNKVQGDFHITARGHGYFDGQQHLDHLNFNFSHIINELSFGAFYPDIHNPLDDTREMTSSHFRKFQYYMSVVPTIWTDMVEEVTHTTPPHTLARAAGRDDVPRNEDIFYNPFLFESIHTLYTNQYAVTEQSMDVPERGVNAQFPGIYFKYDIEPILLMVSEEWGGMLGLFIRLVNVVAGIMVAGGWIVSLLDMSGDLVSRRARRSSEAGGLLYGEKRINL